MLAFSTLYKESCFKAIQSFSTNLMVQQKFLADIEHEMCSSFAVIESTKSEGAKLVHSERLEELRPLLQNYKSQNSCFCCLLRMPEKVLDCGHAYCDNCIKTFGARSESKMYTFSLSHCVICSLPHSSQSFTFLPPTAGLRVLSMDGGGVRGIISLTILRQLEADLSYLGCPLRDHFDFVAGTSSGQSCTRLGNIYTNI